MPYANEAEKLFWELGDIQNKKSMTNGARHRVNGSKSKRAASLLSDHYTKKELEAMNGPIASYKMHGITYRELKQYPPEMKRKFVSNLVEKFHANQIQIGKALGVSQRTFCNFIDRNDLKPLFIEKRKMSAEDISSLNAYLKEENGGKEIVNTEPTVELGIVPDETEQSLKERTVCNPDIRPIRMRMKSMMLRFEGVIDANEIANSLLMILGDGAEYGVTIEVETL